MNNESAARNVIMIDEERIKSYLDRVMRGVVWRRR
jgi:hypothetical protein